MSLINNMLRDVSQRDTTEKPRLAADTLAVVAPRNGWRLLDKKKHLLGIGVAGFCLAGVMHFMLFEENTTLQSLMENDPFYALARNAYDKVYALFTPDVHFENLPAEAQEAMDLQHINKSVLTEMQIDGDFYQAPSKVLYFTHQVMDGFFQKDSIQGLHSILAQPETPTVASTLMLAAPIEEVAAVDIKKPAKNTMRRNDRTEQFQADIALSQAAAFVQSGHTESARNTLQSALQAQPLDHDIRAALADLYLESKDLNIAEKLVRAGLDLIPDQPALVRVLARVQAAQGKYESAITLLLNAPPILRDQPEHYSLLAALYQKEGRYDLAAQIYMDLVHFFPQNGRWWTGLGIALEETKDTQAAFDSYMRSLSIANLDPSLRSFALERIEGLSKNQAVVMNGGTMTSSDMVGAR